MTHEKILDNEEVQLFGHLIIGLKSNDEVVEKTLSDECIATAKITLLKNNSKNRLIIDLSGYNNSELEYSGCLEFIETWRSLSDILDIILYIEDSVEFLDFPLEIESQEKTIKLNGLTHSKYEDMVLTLDYLNCDIEKE